MKKVIVLSLIALMVLAFGTMAFAQPKEDPKLEIKISGWIDAQINTNRNVGPGNAAGGMFDVMPAGYKPTSTGSVGSTALDDNTTWWMSRARLKFDAIYGKAASGTILFEFDSDRWGDTPGGQGGKLSERNTYGTWSGDRAAVEVKNIYFDFGVPGIPIPVSFRVGLQPLALRMPLLVYTDGMGITANVNINPVNAQLLYFKALNGADETADDVNVYGLHANARLGTVTVGGYGLYYNMNTYPFTVATTSYGGAYPNIGIARLITGTMKSDMWWFGVYADGKLGPVQVNFDFIYDDGQVESRFTPGVKDADYSGWMTQAKVVYPWQKFEFGGLGMYATGADRDKTASSGLPGTQTTGSRTKVESFVVPPGSEAGPIYGESVVFYSYGGNRGTTGIGLTANYNALSRGGTGGTWLAKLFASYKATPWYKVTFQGMYIGDTTKNGNTVGTAVKASGAYRDDGDIGWEFDLINEIQILKSLKLIVAGGFLWAGDALDYRIGTTNTNHSPKNPWAITTNLTFNF